MLATQLAPVSSGMPETASPNSGLSLALGSSASQPETAVSSLGLYVPAGSTSLGPRLLRGGMEELDG